MKKFIVKIEKPLTEIVLDYRQFLGGSDEPLDGDEVNKLCSLIKKVINEMEGNN